MYLILGYVCVCVNNFKKIEMLKVNIYLDVSLKLNMDGFHNRELLGLGRELVWFDRESALLVNELVWIDRKSVR